MISVEALKGFFQRSSKSFLLMRRDAVFGVSLHPGTLPDANDYPHGIAANEADGVQISVPDGLGGYEWVSVNSLRNP